MMNGLKNEVKFLFLRPRNSLSLNFYRLLYRIKKHERYPGYFFLLNQFKKHKFLFIHIPKTGGTSINFALFGINVSNHNRCIDYINEFGFDNLKYNYFKFCFVRHPEDRFVSAYNFIKKNGTQDLNIKKMELYKNFYEKYLKESNNINHFVNKAFVEPEVKNFVFFIPQFKFIIDENKQIFVDKIAYFENFKCDSKNILNKINFNKYNVTRKNVGKPSHIEEHLSNDSRKIIETHYNVDYELFKYKKRSR